MAGSDSSKDTQEEKSQLHHTDLPSCLKLDVRREEQWTKSTEDPKGNVMLSCLKVPKDKGPGEKRRCQSYTCMSGLTQRNCSAIKFIQTYQPIQCPEEGQKLQQEMQQKSHKCWTKSDKDFEDLDLCCPPEVLQGVTLKMEKLLANEKQQLSATDPQEANLDHQTPKTPRDHRTFPRTSRRFQEWHNLGSPAPMLHHPTHTQFPLCLDTSPGYQHPGLGQESSQGWVIAVGTLGALGFLVLLLVRWWRGRRGRREGWHLREETLSVEEELGRRQDGDEGNPGM